MSRPAACALLPLVAFPALADDAPSLINCQRVPIDQHLASNAQAVTIANAIRGE